MRLVMCVVQWKAGGEIFPVQFHFCHFLTCQLKGAVTSLINLYQSTLLIHELLLDHKGTILNEFSKEKNKQKISF